jgi:hypothetical protein
MGTKVIYSGFNEPFWLDVADYLLEKHEWQPVYWIGRLEDKPHITARFPGIIFQSSVNAVKGVNPDGYINANTSLFPLDKPLLDNLTKCQVTALRMMNRMDALGSFDYHARVRHYHRLLQYWLAVIEHLQPDIVFFKEIPHMVYDYVLYELCKLKNIPTMMFLISNLRRLWILTDTIYGENDVIKRYKELLSDLPDGEVSLRPETENYLQSFKAGYEDTPSFVSFVKKQDYLSDPDNLSILEKISSLEKYHHYIKKQIRILTSRFRAPRNYLKQHRKKVETSSMSLLAYRWFRFRAKIKMHYMAWYYRKLTQELDFSKPYIYVPLTYQPEANSSPKGGVFANLELMVHLITRCIPDDWYVYIKEHPSQLHPAWAYRSQSARNTVFYDDLCSLPNVYFVPMSSSPYDLIDNAKAVATLTGTSGFQAVVRGVPTLMFGYTWYRGCEGVFHVESVNDCRKAINKIASGYQIDQTKVRLFLYALEEVGVSEYVEKKWKHFFEDSNNPEAMARKLHEFSHRLT